MKKRLNILGLNYTVEFKNLALGKQECGNCSPDTLEIEIDANLPPDKHNVSLFHEIIHAALYETGNRKEYTNERLIDNLALALYQTLRDSGALNMQWEMLKESSRV